MRDNKNGPLGATDMLAVMVGFYTQRRRLITIVHSEGAVMVDDPRISIIPRDVRMQGFNASFLWLNKHPCVCIVADMALLTPFIQFNCPTTIRYVCTDSNLSGHADTHTHTPHAAVRVLELHDTFRDKVRQCRRFEEQVDHVTACRVSERCVVLKQLEVDRQAVADRTAKALAELDAEYMPTINDRTIAEDGMHRSLVELDRQIKALDVAMAYREVLTWRADDVITALRGVHIQHDADALRRDSIDGKIMMECNSEDYAMRYLHIKTFGDAFRVREFCVSVSRGEGQPSKLEPCAGHVDIMRWTCDKVAAHLSSSGFDELSGPFLEARISGYVLIRAPPARLFAATKQPLTHFRRFAAHVAELRASVDPRDLPKLDV